jgi:cytochrome b561
MADRRLAMRRFPPALYTTGLASAPPMAHLAPSSNGNHPMSITKTSAGYSRLQIIIHWTVAALVLFQLFISEGMEEAWDARMDGEIGGNPLPHIIVGSAILILAIVRVFVRMRHGAPAHPKDQPAIFGTLANIVHGLIYAMIFAMPIAGMLAWFGGFESAAQAHAGPLKLLLWILVAAHVLAALGQQFVLRSGVLMRMLKPER